MQRVEGTIARITHRSFSLCVERRLAIETVGTGPNPIREACASRRLRLGRSLFGGARIHSSPFATHFEFVVALWTLHFEVVASSRSVFRDFERPAIPEVGGIE